MSASRILWDFFLEFFWGDFSVNSKGNFKGNKANLPQKVCATCGLTFTWRKKWAKNWEEVKYCSDRCRRHKGEVL